MGEFELIQRYFVRKQPTSSNVLLGIGDDAALLHVPEGELLVVSVDTLVSGVHFLPDTPAERVAQRALGAAVSDLAAMGARPLWYTLALTLPDLSESWLDSFASALAQRSAELGITLIGGDTTRGPLALSLTVHGSVSKEHALKRQGACVGDWVAVTGTLGDSRAGLESLLHPQKASLSSLEWLRERFYQPEPRLTMAQAMAPYLTSAIDISDGLMADLGHILKASDCGAELDVERLPYSEALIDFTKDEQKREEWALTGGEDFELCVTFSQQHWSRLQSIAQVQQVPLTVIGRIIAAPTLCLLKQGEPLVQGYSQQGYDHFKGV
ncbi:thiamine-phosphate kinase [Nitrincola schmidtii]|uniref:thiamine-phosphate kinase n=1 Tax=Nitrincola schmidtii TaxID=1730894 RepID=UPI00124D85B0|nr:thiamine-phosphate kinase [Nitrincola schmidtii]